MKKYKKHLGFFNVFCLFQITLQTTLSRNSFSLYAAQQLEK